MADPTANTVDLAGSVKNLIGSTAKILVGLNKAMLGVDKLNLAENDPIITAIKLFTVVNCKTAQVATQVASLPDISMAREKVEVTLSKLNTLATPSAKANFALFIGQYKAPAENVKLQLNALDNLRNQYKTMIQHQHESIVEIIDKLKSASDPAALLRSQEIKTEFSSQDSTRERLLGSLAALDKELQVTQTTLESIFKNSLSAIPHEDRKGITAKITPAAAPDERQRNAPE